MKKIINLCLLILLSISPGLLRGQAAHEKVDSTAVAAFMSAEMEKSQVMEILRMLTDVHGPRLSFSPGYKAAANYARQTMESWGLTNVHYDPWGEMGRGWSIKKFNVDMVSPSYVPLIGYPKAWSPGVKGSVVGEVVFLDVKSEADLVKYKNKLKGKIIMMDPPPTIKIGWEPYGVRFADSTLLKFANDETEEGMRRYRGAGEEMLYKKWKMLMEEGVAGVISSSSGNNGIMNVSGAYMPVLPETPRMERPKAFSPDAPATLPQVVLLTEHYNRIYRLVTMGTPVKVELTLSTTLAPAEEGFNVIAEIPGTDLKDEIVMIGAHLDSWHSATGSTDNGAGSAVCMETMRLLKALGMQPRRTIRIGLWGGEEQGLLGSRGYVKKHLGAMVDGKAVLTPEAARFSSYFNMDNGTGKFRGIYLQKNEAARNIFKEWLKPFHSMGAATITSSNTGGTDHLAFVGVGLPGFQFIQDPVEYMTRTHHTNLDVYDKSIEDDLKQNVVMMATFAWLAATRDEPIPRPGSSN